MAEQPSQFKVYAAEAAIPGYQRAWVWGTAALAVLLCGVLAGWLLGGGSASPVSGNGVDPAALLARQEAINAGLRERIAELDRTLGGEVCAPAALKASGE